MHISAKFQLKRSIGFRDTARYIIQQLIILTLNPRKFHMAERYFQCFVSKNIICKKYLSKINIYTYHIFLVISRHLAAFLETDLKMQMDQIVPNTSPTMCVNRLKWVHTTKSSFIVIFPLKWSKTTMIWGPYNLIATI